MKIQAVHNARKIGIDALRSAADVTGRALYKALGLRPSKFAIAISRTGFPQRLRHVIAPTSGPVAPIYRKDKYMSLEENKAVVGRWFTEFWGNPFNAEIIDEIAAPDIRFEYSLHKPMRGRDEVREFATKFRTAFPDLNFWGTADLIAEGDYVVGQWEGGGTHTGPIVFDDLPIGSVSAASGKTLRFTGTTVLKVQNGLVVEEVGLDDGVKVLQQLGIIPIA